MSDAEKLVDYGIKYPAEPLILRPPVGDEVFRGLGTYNPTTTRRSHGFCWPRSFVLRMMLVCILLATVAGCVLIVFALRHSNTWPWGYTHTMMRRGFCRAITPFPGIDVSEDYMIESKAFMISHAPVAGFPPVTVFHLLGDDGMTVMHSEGSCYVYPMTPEVAEAIPTDDSFVERIQELSNEVQFKSPITPQVFVMSPDNGNRVRIHHQQASSMCSNKPIFRLVEMVLAQVAVQIDANSQSGVVMAPDACPKECPAGESRDSILGQVARQVCRCPPNEIPPTNLLTNNNNVGGDQQPMPLPVGEGGDPAAADYIPMAGENDYIDEDDEDADFDDSADWDDDEEDEEDDDLVLGDRFGDFDESLRDGNAWIPEGKVGAERTRRSAEQLHNLESPVKVPAHCRVQKQILGAATPNTRSHDLPLITILQC